MTVSELHKLACSRGLPPREVHQILHDMAVLAFQDADPPVQSLKDCTPEQLEGLAEGIRNTFQRPPSPPFKSKRPRKGRPARDGVVLMISERQVDLIKIIASELGWTASQLSAYLQRYFGVAEPRELGTSRNGVECVRRLRSIKFERRQRQAAAGS